MPPDADPPSLSFSAVTDALKAFPKPIFTLWLRFRRHSADLVNPHWRNTQDKRNKIRLLDQSAKDAAEFN